MTDFDPLELELAALRPREPSVELKRRIAARIAAMPFQQGKEHRSLWRGGVFVGGLLAASLAAVVAWQTDGPQAQPRPAATLNTELAAAFDESLPSLWSYRRALSQEPDSLSELLDRHASGSLEPGATAPAFVVARSNFDIDALTGEL